MVFATAIFISGCGSEMGVDDLEDAAAVVDEVAADDVERVILSQGYDGYLMIHLDESLGARLDSSKSFYSKGESSESGEKGQLLASISSSVKSYTGAELSRSVEADEDATDERRAELEHLSGMTLVDWNSIYRIDVSDPSEAIKLYRELKGKSGIKEIYPGLKTSPKSLSSTPDLTVWQGYLYADSTHGGLNAKAAWDVGVKGAGVWLVDDESGFNLSHEDYSLDTLGTPACTETSTQLNCPPTVAHGTAMLGIMAGLENSHGITGMAPSADLKVVSPATPGSELQVLTDGVGVNDLPPGSIFLISYQLPGALTPYPGYCSVNPYGCMAPSSYLLVFAAVQQATAAGVTVIDGAGNGSVDLDNSSVYYGPWQKNLSKEDPGSIIVGSSLGANHQKISSSNWGTPVHVYGWGAGVATTGFPYSGSGFKWTGTKAPVPPNTDTNELVAQTPKGVIARSGATKQSPVTR